MVARQPSIEKHKAQTRNKRDVSESKKVHSSGGRSCGRVHWEEADVALCHMHLPRLALTPQAAQCTVEAGQAACPCHRWQRFIISKYVSGTKRRRGKHTDTDTHRHTQTHTDTHRQTDKHRHTQTHTHTRTDTHTHIDTHNTDKTDRHTHMQTLRASLPICACMWCRVVFRAQEQAGDSALAQRRCRRG